jgi:hypothetical protein
MLEGCFGKKLHYNAVFVFAKKSKMQSYFVLEKIRRRRAGSFAMRKMFARVECRTLKERPNFLG